MAQWLRDVTQNREFAMQNPVWFSSLSVLPSLSVMDQNPSLVASMTKNFPSYSCD